MKLFHKVLLVTAVSFSALSVAAHADEIIKVGIENDYKPFSYVDSNNKLQGFDVDIANALCVKMHAKCVFVQQDWDGMIPGLIARKYDAIISSMTVTPERQQKVAFTNRYYSATLAVAVAKDSDIKSTSPQDMKGKVIGEQTASVQAEYAENVYAKAGADVKYYSAQSDVNNELAIGRIDATVHDIYPLLEWLNTAGKDCCKLLGKVGKRDDIAIALRKEDNPLRERFNQAISDIRADGTYNKIAKKYFGNVDIYN